MTARLDVAQELVPGDSSGVCMCSQSDRIVLQLTVNAFATLRTFEKAAFLEATG
jgi:hypothetical protein